MVTTIGTHIKVKDFNKSLLFYETLGFQKYLVWTEQNVKEHTTELSLPRW